MNTYQLANRYRKNIRLLRLLGPAVVLTCALTSVTKGSPPELQNKQARSPVAARSDFELERHIRIMRTLYEEGFADLELAGGQGIEFAGDPLQRSLLVSGNGSFDIESFNATTGEFAGSDASSRR